MAVLLPVRHISAMFTCQPISALLLCILSTAAPLKLCHNKTRETAGSAFRRWRRLNGICLNLGVQFCNSKVFKALKCVPYCEWWSPKVTYLVWNILCYWEKLEIWCQVFRGFHHFNNKFSCFLTCLCFVRQLVNVRPSERNEGIRDNLWSETVHPVNRWTPTSPLTPSGQSMAMKHVNTNRISPHLQHEMTSFRNPASLLPARILFFRSVVFI